MLKIKPVTSKTIHVVQLSGKFSIEQVGQFDASVTKDMIKNVKTVAICLSDIEYIDSSALGSLIKMMNMVKSTGKEFVLFDIAEPIMNIVRIANLDKFFTITTSRSLMMKHPEADL